LPERKIITCNTVVEIRREKTKSVLCLSLLSLSLSLSSLLRFRVKHSIMMDPLALQERAHVPRVYKAIRNLPPWEIPPPLFPHTSMNGLKGYTVSRKGYGRESPGFRQNWASRVEKLHRNNLK
jgi:hypothetical protein